MDYKLDGLAAKLRLLGNKVEVTGDTSLIATDKLTGKMKVITREHGKTVVSEEFDHIENLSGSDCSLVRLRKKFGIIHGAERLARERTYPKLGKSIVASSGKYNMIARLSNGLYGVVDTDDTAIIPFIHSQIDLYKMRDSWLYTGTTLDIKKVYKDNGELHKISSTLAVVNDIIVCSDFIIMYEIGSRRTYGRCTVFDTSGQVMISAKMANIVNEGTCHQLVSESGEILLHNIVECAKY